MEILIEADTAVVFDLDDTIYKEREFVRSGLHAVSSLIHKQVPELCGEKTFDRLWELFLQRDRQSRLFDTFLEAFQDNPDFPSLETILEKYRGHMPTLELPQSTRQVIEKLLNLGVPLGMITDGRSLTQRNKLQALGIEPCFTKIVISEEVGQKKPAETNYLAIERQISASRYIYIGDNVSKDFITPKKLGWTTVCILDDGTHIHAQDFGLADEYLPHIRISDLDQLLNH